MLPGWLATSVRDASWAAAGDTPAVRMLKRYAELIGKNSSNPATLMDNDILGDYRNKDQVSDLYNMVIHADKVCLAGGSHTPLLLLLT